MSKSNSGIGRTKEIAFNSALAEALRSIHPVWKEDKNLIAESTQQIVGSPGKSPDIVILQPGGVPVVVETEFHPASSAKKDAKNRIGKKLESHVSAIEQAIAVRIPIELAYANQTQLKRKIKKSEFEICLIKRVFDENQEDSQEVEYWPKNGWLRGNLEDLADIIEFAARSENAEIKGMNCLENAIKRSSNYLIRECSSTPRVLRKISRTLKQKYRDKEEQPIRMAMSIVVNAITFHMSLSGRHDDIDTLDEIWESRKHDKNLLLDKWKVIIEEINYYPIFDTARKILLPINDKVCRNCKHSFARSNQ